MSIAPLFAALKAALAPAGWPWRANPLSGGALAQLCAPGTTARLFMAPGPRADAPAELPAPEAADAFISAEAPLDSLKRAAGLALRRAANRTVWSTCEAAGQRHNLSNRQSTPFCGPPRAMYLGQPKPAFLALERALNARGVGLFAAITPVSALEHAKADRADLLLIDAAPGVERAVAILSALHRNSRTAALPAIAVVGDDGAKIAGPLYAAGAALVCTNTDLPAAADWICALIRHTRKGAEAERALASWADAGMADHAAARGFRDVLAERLARQGAAFSALQRLANPRQRNDAMAMTRRVLRPVDWVFATGPDRLIVASPAYCQNAAPAIIARANQVLAHAGLAPAL